MKKIKFIILFFIALFITIPNVNAANITSSAQTVYPGQSFNVSVSLFAASWNVHTSTSGPVSGCIMNDANASDTAMNVNKVVSATCTATGVGTMSFYEPTTKTFGILGHGIIDGDTNSLINIDSGELVTAKILSLKKAECGVPGEIKGTIINSQTIGDIRKNTPFGVFGILNNITALNIDTSKTMEIALRNEIEVGKASVLCAFNDNNIAKEYDVKIEKIYKDNDFNNKSMLVKITDENLLNETGGIIRGLSGAPIIQNGKFIGAITNVLVSDPSVGYAIFADLMIKELNKSID